MITMEAAPMAIPDRPELTAPPITSRISVFLRPKRSSMVPTTSDTRNTPMVAQVLTAVALAVVQPKSSAMTGNRVPNRV